MIPTVESVLEAEIRAAEYCHGKPLNENGWRDVALGMRDFARKLEDAQSPKTPQIASNGHKKASQKREALCYLFADLHNSKAVFTAANSRSNSRANSAGTIQTNLGLTI